MFCRLLDRLAEPSVAFALRNYSTQLINFVRFVAIGRNRLGNSIGALQLAGSLTVSILMTPVCAITHAAGFRFLSIDLTQIGSVLWLDLFLKDNAMDARAPSGKILVTRSRYTDCNSAALDLYEGHVTFIRNPFLKLLLNPFFMNPWFQQTVHRYELTSTFYCDDAKKRTFAHEVYQRYEAAHHAPLIRLSLEQKEAGKQILASLKRDDRPFVVMHVREPGYYGDPHRALRNGNIRSNVAAIKYLISRGYTVVRAGDPKMSDISDLIDRCGPHLLDYARSPHQSPFMDCYLLSECTFFVGGSSGLTFLAYVFGKPVCSVNWYNASIGLGFRSDDRLLFKKLKDKKTGQLIPFRELMRRPLKRNLKSHSMADLGFCLEDNSPDEIRATVEEFVEGAADKDEPLNARAKDLVPPGTYSHGAAGKFSTALLRYYDQQNAL